MMIEYFNNYTIELSKYFPNFKEAAIALNVLNHDQNAIRGLSLFEGLMNELYINVEIIFLSNRTEMSREMLEKLEITLMYINSGDDENEEVSTDEIDIRASYDLFEEDSTSPIYNKF